jgi:hypothetical protein
VRTWREVGGERDVCSAPLEQNRYGIVGRIWTHSPSARLDSVTQLSKSDSETGINAQYEWSVCAQGIKSLRS